MKEPFLYRICRPIIKLFTSFYFNPKIINKEFIPKDGKIVLAGNHTSIYDCILLISCTKRTVHFLAKEELSHGLKKVIFKNMGIIFVNRKIHDKAALKSAIDVLNNDKVIGIFPEGTVSKTGEILPFKIGAVKMAAESGSMIVPFSISGKYKFRSRDLIIKFSEPIKIENLSDLSDQNENLRKIISSNRGEV